MVKVLLLAVTLAQVSEDLKREGIDGFKRGGFEAVAWLELGCIIALGLTLWWREKQHRTDLAEKDKVITAKDNELRDLNRVTRDTLISDSKAIDAIANTLKSHTDVIVRHFK